MSTDQIENIFTPGGILSQALPYYESRPGQLSMAKAVAVTLALPKDTNSLAKAQMLAVEAETGIGKTLAYLVPAVLSGQKVVVSTGTLNLQEQILNKEIPLIKRHIYPELRAVCVKGRQNYLCLYRAKQFLSEPQMRLFKRSTELEDLNEWVNTTRSGDRAELTWLPDYSPLWEQVCSYTAKCLGGKCPDNADCFVGKLRKMAAKAHILIVNHHLFFSDLAIRRFGHAEVLPRYQTVIFDEAHHLENVATRYFGTSFSMYQVRDLVRDIEEMALVGLKKNIRQKTNQIARALAAQASEFSNIFPKKRGRYNLPEIIEQTAGWNVELNTLFTALDSLNRQLESIALADESWEGLKRRGLELGDNLALTTTDMNSSSVYWCERREKTITLAASPIEVASDFRDHLYSQVNSIIFTSATLTTGRKFDYMFKRFGLDNDTETMSLSSPFDYAERTKLYIPPNDFPEPNAAGYSRAVQEQSLQIIKASKGRALLLFTSLYAMREMRSFLADTLPYSILMQGDAPKSQLLETFQKKSDSILLAVASFWEGVNVPGESLSCVIIDKLPFEVPSDPVIKARVNRIQEEGGKPFFDFQVPRAILALRQGVGRLMRATTDQGLLAVMDIRLYSKGYGRQFLKSMPASPIIRTMAEVKEFFLSTDKRVCEIPESRNSKEVY